MISGSRIFECIPNVSEGRDRAVIDACAQAIVDAGATLADRTSDVTHHRSVFTFFGSREVVLDAVTRLAEVTTQRIDLRAHVGAHPRIGSLDVLPFVPLGRATMQDAIEVAQSAASQIWQRFAVPSFFYGALAAREVRPELPEIRRGGFEALVRLGRNARAPEVGTLPVHSRAGAIAVGVRGPLVAYNVVLASDDLELAREIASTLRERDGGLRTLRCLAIALADATVQVSCNITDPGSVDLGLVYDLVARLARTRGVAVKSSELIGLVPRQTLVRLMARDFGIDPEAFAPICST